MARTNYTDFYVADEFAVTGIRVDCAGKNSTIH